MKNLTNKKGFTLIELLVVIAIIGILSGIILISLSQSRLKAKDGAVRSSVAGIRIVMETYYDDYATYSIGGEYSYSQSAAPFLSGCGPDDVAEDNNAFATPEAMVYLKDIVNNVREQKAGEVRCYVDSRVYALAVKLPTTDDGSKPNTAWCVDSAGYDGPITWNIVSSTIEDGNCLPE